MTLTEHFTLEELTASETAARKGIDNTVPVTLMPNIRFLARQLEKIRDVIKKGIRVNSGYRCDELNRAVGGSLSSAHRHCLAADIISPAFGPPLKLCQAVALIPDFPYDQIIYEFGSWCHVGFVNPGDTPRRELLTINKNGTVKGLIV